jgi:hypothetical protein
MFQFAGARLFEAGNFATLWIAPGHDVPDSAVLAGGVHFLNSSA